MSVVQRLDKGGGWVILIRSDYDDKLQINTYNIFDLSKFCMCEENQAKQVKKKANKILQNPQIFFFLNYTTPQTFRRLIKTTS